MTSRLRRRRPPRGFALVALMALIVAGVLYFVVSALTPAAMEAYRARKTQEALAEARDALLGYMLKYRDEEASQGRPDRMYGYLPLPDLGSSRNNNVTCGSEGCDAAFFNGITYDINGMGPTAIGRFPWRVLGTGPIRDGYGECLWLVVSSSHGRILKTSPPATPPAMNWDTLGQLDVVVANGSGNLSSILASPHERPVAIVFSPGPPLPGQNRTASAVDAIDQCGGNYDARNYLDPATAGALAGVTNFFAGSTNNASADTSGSPKAFAAQGVIQRRTSDATLWSQGCPGGAECAPAANDAGLALTADTLFGALRKSSGFRVDINSMLDRMVGCLRDARAAGGTLPPDGKITGANNDPCYGKDVVPRGYYPNYKDMIFVASPPGLSVTTDMVLQPACAGALIFASQRSATQSRATAADRASFANYLEMPNSGSIAAAGTVYAGAGLFGPVAASAGNADDVKRCAPGGVWQVTPQCLTADQDIVRCIPAGASFATVTSPALTSLGFGQLAAYDPGARILTLGQPNATTGNGVPAGALYGCAWQPETNAQGLGFRAYFTFQFNTLGTGVGTTGFAFAAIDAESNPLLPCGASGSHLGYSGDNGATPHVAFPKIGIEFDQSRNAGFSEASGNPGRNDPCGTSGCGGSAGFNSHAAIVYWGHETANAMDGVTLPSNDDNVHGFPMTGSEASNLAPPPRNPDNLGAAQPGIAFIDMRGKSALSGNSYLYHVRVEITPLASLNSLANTRTAVASNVDIANPGALLGGTTLASGDRVLLAGQASPAEGGIYVWHDAATPMTRSADANNGSQLIQATVQVDEGAHAKSIWRQTRPIGMIGVDPQNWQPFVQDFKTEVWIDHGNGTPLVTAMEDTTRPMAQLAPTATPTLRDIATIHGVAGAVCGTGCPTGQVCAPGNRCVRQPMKSIRLGFTASQWTQDEQVNIRDFFATWLQ